MVDSSVKSLRFVGHNDWAIEHAAYELTAGTNPYARKAADLS
jgi:hypothetical protein